MSETDSRGFPRSFNAYRPPLHFIYGVLCMSSNGKILLVKGRQSSKWSFPKGHRNRGELAIDCALRELLEETGIILERPVEYPKSFRFSKNRNTDGPEYFYFEVDRELPIMIRDTREIEEAGWFSIEEIRRLPGNIDVNKFVRQYKCLAEN